MKALLGAAVFCLFCINCFSQTGQQIVIKAGEDMSEFYKRIYYYPSFQRGKVYFLNKDSSGALLNYNLLTDAIQFIGNKGDTLDIANENEVQYLTIGKDTFLRNEGYFKVVSNYNFAKLAIKQKIKADRKRLGAFGIPTAVHNVDARETLLGDQNYKLQIAEDVTLIAESEYFIAGGKNVAVANKKNILKIFPKQKDKIEAFLQQNNTNFNKEEDLKNLFSYLQTL